MGEYGVSIARTRAAEDSLLHSPTGVAGPGCYEWVAALPTSGEWDARTASKCGWRERRAGARPVWGDGEWVMAGGWWWQAWCSRVPAGSGEAMFSSRVALALCAA